MSLTIFQAMALGLLSFVAHATNAFARTYVVRPGDTLADIAAQSAHGELYARQGTLSKLMHLNAQIQNPNILSPGDHIYLSNEDRSMATLNPEGFIKIPARPVVISSRSLIKTRRPASVEALAPIVITSRTVQSPPAKLPSAGYGIFSPSSEFLSTKITGSGNLTNSKASLVSKSHFGYAANYTHMWTEKFQSRFYFGINKLNMKQPNNGGSLSETNQSLYSLGAVGQLRLSTKVLLGVGLGLAQRTYLRAISESSVALDPLAVPNFFTELSYDFLNLNPFTMGTSLKLGLDLAAKDSAYKTKINPFYTASLYVKHNLSQRFQSEIGLKANSQKENTSLVHQSQSDYGLYLKFNLAFSAAN